MSTPAGPAPSFVQRPTTASLRWHAFVRKINRPVVAILAVGLIAGYLRFVHLGYPEHRVFDEYYYTKSACIFLGYSDDRCDINSADERFWRENEWDTGAWVHPPLGKWMIAFGELAFGTGSVGWRVSAAATGTATVILLAVIIQLLFASPIWTFTGGLLLATESLNLVQSRTGILDIFVAFWVVLLFLFLLLDRRWIERRTGAAIAAAEANALPPIAGGSDTAVATVGGDGSGPTTTVDGAERQPQPRVQRRLPSPLWRPYRFAAGAAGGAAMATKWSGITACVTAALIGFGWEVMRRKRFGTKSPFMRTLTTEGFGLVLAFAVTPAIVYFASWIPWFMHFHWDFARWAEVQQKSWNFHRDLKATNDQGQPWSPYFSPAWQWIILRRPVYYYGAFSDGIRQVIYAQGSPLIFWGAIAAIPYTAFAWWRKRDWRAAFVFVTVAGLYLPWFAVSRPQFLFYATPITPFFVLACVYALRDLSQVHIAGSRSRPFLPLVVGFVAASVILFFWFWPVLTAGPLTDAEFALRTWFPSWS